MYKKCMLNCEIWNPIDGTWNKDTLFFDTEEEMKRYIKFKKNEIKVEAMFKLEKL